MTTSNNHVGKSYKAMYKSELADRAGVSLGTLARWLRNPKHAAVLHEMGIQTRTKLLPPNAVRYICDTFCIDVE